MDGKPHATEQHPSVIVYSADGTVTLQWEDEVWRPHREGGPAVVESSPKGDVTDYWYVHGVPPTDEPSVVKRSKRVTVLKWTDEDGEAHREGAPAVIWTRNDDGSVERELWFHHGQPVEIDSGRVTQGPHKRFFNRAGVPMIQLELPDQHQLVRNVVDERRFEEITSSHEFAAFMSSERYIAVAQTMAFRSRYILQNTLGVTNPVTDEVRIVEWDRDHVGRQDPPLFSDRTKQVIEEAKQHDRLVIVPIAWRYRDPNTNQLLGHQMLFIINWRQQFGFLFDSQHQHQDTVLVVLRREFPTLAVYSSDELQCPGQIQRDDFLCASWSAYAAHLLVLNAHVAFTSVLNYMSSNSYDDRILRLMVFLFTLEEDAVQFREQELAGKRGASVLASDNEWRHNVTHVPRNVSDALHHRTKRLRAGKLLGFVLQ